MELIQAYLEKTNQEAIHVYGSKGNAHFMSIYLNQRQRPLPRPAFVPEGFTQREDGFIVPVSTNENTSRNNTLYSESLLISRLEEQAERLNKKSKTMRKLFLLSAIMTFIFNFIYVFAIPYIPFIDERVPLGFIPLPFLIITLFLYRRTTWKYEDKQQELMKLEAERIL
jgi:drug/metabolite transporter (DMT)-like permease